MWYRKGKTEIITVMAVKRIIFLRNLPAISLVGFVFPTQCGGKKNPSIKIKFLHYKNRQESPKPPIALPKRQGDGHRLRENGVTFHQRSCCSRMYAQGIWLTCRKWSVFLYLQLMGNWKVRVRDAASLNYAQEERDQWEGTHSIPPSNILAAACPAARFGWVLGVTRQQLVIGFSRGRGSKEDVPNRPGKVHLS